MNMNKGRDVGIGRERSSSTGSVGSKGTLEDWYKRKRETTGGRIGEEGEEISPIRLSKKM